MTGNQSDTSNMKAREELESSLSTSDSELESRISALVDTFPSRVEAARIAGLSTEQLRRYEHGAAPRLEPIARLAEAAGWSIDYVWRGKIASESPPLMASRSTTPPPGVGDEGDYRYRETVSIPIYDVEAAAGDGALVSSESVLGYYPVSRELLRTKGWYVRDLGFITGRGDSMPGVIDDGGLVLINLAETTVRRAGIYLLLLDEHLVIKAVQINHRGDLVIHSTNTAYRDIEVPRGEIDQLRVVGQAVWTPRLL